MEKLILKLERKLGRFAIPHLTFFMIGFYVIGYILAAINEEAAGFMALNPALILKGQVWRIFTWIVIPPRALEGNFLSLFLTIVMLFFYLSIGTNLERAWGNFRYNLYIFGGMLITLIAAFVIYFILSAAAGAGESGELIVGGFIGAFTSTYYILMSMFLGFAATFPDAQVYLYFVLPIRVKWLGIIYFALMIYDAIGFIRMIAAGGIIYWIPVVIMAASIMNFLIFYFSTRGNIISRMQSAKRRRDYDRSVEEGRRAFSANVDHARSGAGPAARHRCEICGRTELTDPDLEFRFCSKCGGSHEYCMEHLFTHTHVQE